MNEGKVKNIAVFALILSLLAISTGTSIISNFYNNSSYFSCGNCTNGVNGSNGIDGVPGMNGINGTNGLNGINGTTDYDKSGGFDFIINNSGSIIPIGYQGTISAKYAGNISYIEIIPSYSQTGRLNITIGNTFINMSGGYYYNDTLSGNLSLYKRQHINISIENITTFTQITVCVGVNKS
jgi:hypothetical protein